MSIMNTIRRAAEKSYEFTAQTVGNAAQTTVACIQYTPEMYAAGAAKAQARLAPLHNKYAAARAARLAKEAEQEAAEQAAISIIIAS